MMEKKLRDMVDEDLGAGDVTLPFTPNRRVRAEIIAKEPAVVSGAAILKTLFSMFDIDVVDSVEDGCDIKEGGRVFLLEGNAHSILVVERTALNILSRMSGISSLTREYIEKAGGVRVAATRKTTPLFGYFEKEAVRIAGGDTHRLGLYDCVLIKDNHLKLFRDVADAVGEARKETSFVHKIEVEVSNTGDAVEAAKAGADIILLDNMSPEEIRDTVSRLCKMDMLSKTGPGKRLLLEASGNITLDNLDEYSGTGVDVISVGALTHSVCGRDFSLGIL